LFQVARTKLTHQKINLVVVIGIVNLISDVEEKRLL
jgi:hypothetical protein